MTDSRQKVKAYYLKTEKKIGSTQNMRDLSKTKVILYITNLWLNIVLERGIKTNEKV